MRGLEPDRQFRGIDAGKDRLTRSHIVSQPAGLELILREILIFATYQSGRSRSRTTFSTFQTGKY